jgi:hypothetical protein
MHCSSQLLEVAVSLIVSRAVWELSKAQSSTDRLVLLCLADHASDDGLAWPCVDTIATECHLGRRGVQKILRRLVTSGELTIERAGGGKSRTTRYRVTANGGSLYKKLGTRQTANHRIHTANSGSPEPLTEWEAREKSLTAGEKAHLLHHRRFVPKKKAGIEMKKAE